MNIILTDNNQQPTIPMNEDKLFNIQANQLNDQIESIKWIAENQDELIRALRAKVANENADYFNTGKNAEQIFRGQYISEFCDNYVREQLA